MYVCMYVCTLHVDKSLKMAAKLGDCRELGKFTEL